jgi:hypothetical protein
VPPGKVVQPAVLVQPDKVVQLAVLEQRGK